MTINSEIKVVLRSYGIPVDDGLSYLVSLHFDIRPSYTPSLLIEKINRSGIISFDDGTKTIQWNIPLFDEQVTGFEWVKNEYLQLFRERNKDKVGGVKDTIARMKKFFATYPEIRKDDVIEATKMYLKSVNNSTYIIMSHYFISKGSGSDRTQNLLHWVERYKESIQDDVSRQSHNITMKG